MAEHAKLHDSMRLILKWNILWINNDTNNIVS
jgi:hypothetical protein